MRPSVLLFVVAGVAVLLAAEEPPTAPAPEILNLERDVQAGADTISILRTTDKRQLNRYVAKTYELQHAHPVEVLPFLRDIASLEGGTAATAWNVSEEGSSRQWIQVNVPEFQLPYIDSLVKSYDTPGFRSVTGRIVYSYRTKFRDAEEIATIIKATTLSPDGRVEGDSETNTLYLSETPSGFRRVFSQVLFYDVPTAQLAIEVQFIELLRVDDEQIGLDWDAWRGAVTGGVDLRYRDIESSAGLPDSTVRSLDALLSLDAEVLARFLNFVEERGGARTITRSTINVSNGREGILRSNTGLQTKVSDVEDYDRSDAPTEGIELRLKPSITMMSARIDVQLSTTGPAGFADDGTVILATQTVTASLTSFDDQLQKLGGTTRTAAATERKGLPGLKDVPLIWPLFATERRIIRETQLLTFIRPRWSSALLPDADAMQTDGPLDAVFVDEILRLNPSLRLTEEDERLYREVFGEPGRLLPDHPHPPSPPETVDRPLE
ncbi:MAG: hypothetical protein SF028_08450 [Candidatus Sumerlaeia bacterium]|nr:hypothetical protein [Candidatus Sumerlaeia bacterium]